MKPIPALSVLAALLPIGVAVGLDAQSAADSTAIRAAALDYIEGWYEADAERMRRAVHATLAKRIAWHLDGSIIQTTAEELVGQTARGGGSRTPVADQRTEVVILDVFENAAAVRVTAHEWVDYMHLAHVDGEWRIINVLWELSTAGKERAEERRRRRGEGSAGPDRGRLKARTSS